MPLPVVGSVRSGVALVAVGLVGVGLVGVEVVGPGVAAPVLAAPASGPTQITIFPTTTTATTRPSTTSPPTPTTAPPAPPPAPGSTTTLLPPPGGPVPSNPAPPKTTPPPAATVPSTQLTGLLLGIQSDLAQLDALAAYQQDVGTLTQAKAGAASTTSGVAQAVAAQQAAEAELTAAAQAVDSTIHRLSGLALSMYLHDGVGPQVRTSGSVTAVATRRVLLSLLLDQRKREVAAARKALSAVGQSVKAAQDQVKEANAVQVRANETVAQAAANLATDKAAALGKLAAVKKPSGIPIPTIMGPPALTPADLAGWFASTGHQANVTVPMAQLAQDYVDAGAAEGVRSDIAFAQSVIETGFFGFPAGGQLTGNDNNFAGIGACDSCAHGWAFPDARRGVAAQIQLLHAYASRTLIPTPLVGQVGVHGCCPTWAALTGVWATSPTYAFAVLTIYKQILDWAVPKRLAAAGVLVA
jgi:Mannosyl-glycoprotein endo-beta-N-acetylglucosaminidase